MKYKTDNQGRYLFKHNITGEIKTQINILEIKNYSKIPIEEE